MPGLYAKLILPLKLKGSFTYCVPEELRDLIRPGMMALVPFGKNKLYTALVHEVHNETPQAYSPKQIISLSDKYPQVLPEQMDLWDWMSSYYMCSRGEIFKAAFPAGLRPESKSINDEPGREYKPRLEAYIKLKGKYMAEDALNIVFDKLNRAPKQKQSLEGLLFHAEEKEGLDSEIKMSVLLSDRLINKAALEALLKKDILEKIYKESSRFHDYEGLKLKSLKKLTRIQNQKLKEIKDSFKTHDTVLFHGVTSSGKTEIYTHLIKEEIKKGRQVLYLLPEIGLTSQIISKLRSYFGNMVGVYHSRFSDAERSEVWKTMLGQTGTDSYKIILGVRSSVFLPFKNLGLLIIDEEHENSYKQQDPAPRYHARDTSLYLAYLHKAKAILGTATPSLESYYNAERGKYALCELFERHGNMRQPTSILANTREAYKKKKMVSHYTPELYDAISETLEKKKQLILFQNRRGWSPYIQCKQCGWIPRCNNCDVNLTFHKYSNQLNCHYCGLSINMPKACPECGSTDIQTKGFGTEKIEEETHMVFPEARITRMDYDTTRTKRAYHRIISGFEAGKSDILIGTQMVSKGLDFENVKLVGVLNADNLLFFPDFRAYEKSFQMLTQVSGRAGRFLHDSKVIIQTSDPENEVLKWVINGDYKKMYRQQMEERKAFKYPPYYRLINISLKHKDPAILNKASAYLGDLLRNKNMPGIIVLGPEFPLISRIQLWHLKSFLIKVDRRQSFKNVKIFLKENIGKLESNREFRQLQIIPDVDPQ